MRSPSATLSGLSLLTKDDGGKRFYWPAIAGMWRPHVGGGTPRGFGPCGDVLDQNRTLLFRHFERRYPYLLPVIPAAEECLLVPFYVGGKAVGTIWAIMHSDRRKFDAEDERLLTALGQFASVAYQTVESIEDLKMQIAAREKAEAAACELASGLEARVRRLIEANIMGIFIWHPDGRIVEANEAFLRIVGYDRDDLNSGRLRWTDLTPVEWRDADDRRVTELEATGTAQPYEKEYLRKDGSRVPVLIGAAAFEGTSDQGVAFVLDLTERQRADEAVRESDARMRLILDTALDSGHHDRRAGRHNGVERAGRAHVRVGIRRGRGPLHCGAADPAADIAVRITTACGISSPPEWVRSSIAGSRSRQSAGTAVNSPSSCR